MAITCPNDVTVECGTPTNPAHAGAAIPIEGCPDPAMVTVTYADGEVAGSCPRVKVIAPSTSSSEGGGAQSGALESWGDTISLAAAQSSF